MADGSIILDIEARDAGLVQTLAQARQYAAQTATGMAQLAAAILHTGSVSNSTSQATRSLLSALNLTAQGARNLTTAFRQQQSGKKKISLRHDDSADNKTRRRNKGAAAKKTKEKRRLKGVRPNPSPPASGRRPFPTRFYP